VVEHRLAKARVAGSSPVSRSRHPNTPTAGMQGARFQPARRVLRWFEDSFLVYDLLFRRGTQVVRERSAKPLCVGSIPTRASKLRLFLSG